MEVPVWAFSNLCIGRTYDTKNNSAGIDIFQPEIPTKIQNVNRFSFQYKTIKSREDIRDLLNISGNISLKIKANIFKVEGAGKYINNYTKDEGVTEVLAVMKCTTVNKTMDGSANAKPEMVNAPSLGTHYVRSVTYGAEMIASLKFKSSSSTKKWRLTGKLDGPLDIQGVVNAGLEAQLKKLTSDCNNASDLSIEYYATDLPDKNPTDLDDLVKLIQEFPSRLEKINDGQGVPIKLELLPIENIFHELSRVSSGQALECEIDEIESRYDDLCQAQRLVTAYREAEDEIDDEMKKFNTDIIETLRTFRSAISTLDEKNVTDCLKAYKETLDGNDDDKKFVQHWRDLLKKKVLKTPTTSIKLPEGKALSLVLLGKTGNGKSKTGNSILGRQHFHASSSAASVTKSCLLGVREGERYIDVIDTPGVLDTSAVSLMDKARNVVAYLTKNNEVQNKILQEVARIFAMAPDGFDGFIVVVKYGTRFSAEDGQALKMLRKLLGQEACDNMILILTHGDQAELEAEENKETVDETVENWLKSLPEWVRDFVATIKGRVLLLNNCLLPTKEPDEYKKQLSRLITMIDEMTKGKERFVHKLTRTSKEVLEKEIQEALDQSGINEQLKALQMQEEELERQKEMNKKQTQELKEQIKKAQEEKKRMEEEKRDLEKKKEQQNQDVKVKALDQSGINEDVNALQKIKEDIERLTAKLKERDKKQKQNLDEQIKKAQEEKKTIEEEKRKLEKKKRQQQKQDGGTATSPIREKVESGGCYPGSATFADIHGRTRRMECLKVGDKVQVMTNKGIRVEPVITFIHRQPEVIQEFLKIETLKKKILKITEDHLLFVEKEGQAAAIPARDVKIGDTVYVKGDQGAIEEVHNISSVFEKGVYAPVTLSGTILVNDVHTSCYFDVLSHEWSHRAMGVARAVYHVSPWILQCLSGIGQEDGFPGWCRLAHKMLTSMD